MNEDIDNFDTETSAVSEDTIREARSLGWAPREKWRGDPADFVEADEYVRRSQQHLPLVRSQLATERAERAKDKQEFSARVADFERRLQAQAKVHEKALDMQRAAIFEQFEAKKREALTIQDPAQRAAAYEQASRGERAAVERLRETEEPARQAPAQAPQQQQVTPPPAEMIEWGNQNPWFYMNPVMRQEAIQAFGAIEADPSMTITEKLEQVTESIRGRYPQWFQGPAKANGQAGRHQMVEGGGGAARGTPLSRAKGFKELPGEARAACEDLIRRGLAKPKQGEDATKAQARYRAEYASTYWQEYGE